MADKLVHPLRQGYRQLQQLISCLAEGIILVNFDQTILWANQAALSMHGVKRQEDLGNDIDAYRNRFRLTYRDKHPVEDGEFPIERVIAGEAAREVTVEVYPVDAPDKCWVHAIRCFVITDDEGAPDYLVLVIEDQTGRYEAEDRFESAFSANPAPAVICRLSDLCFVRVNRGFQEMTGCRREALLGHSVYEFDILAGREDHDHTLVCLKDWHTIPQGEAVLTLPDGRSKSVIVAGQPIELAEEKCMLFTFVDLDARKQAELESRHSEDRFSKAFALSPVAVAICSLDGLQFVEINAAFARLSGYVEERIIGRSGYELKLWPDRTMEQQIHSALRSSGRVCGLDVRMTTGDGQVVDCLLSAEKITVHDAECVLCIIQDITERKRTETELVAAIEAVMSDTSWFSRNVVEKLGSLRQAARGSTNDIQVKSLTDRERDVLGLICQGASDAEMAEVLCLSRHTIRNHLASLYRKIDVKRRGSAIAWARERGFAERGAGKPKNSKKGS